MVYYLLPPEIHGYSRRLLLLVVVMIILGFEVIRLYKGWLIFGMRGYEGRQVAAYAWATMAAAIALLLFPMHLAVVCLLGMGLIDPLIGEVQEHRPGLYPYIPLLCWGILAVIVFVVLTDHHMVVVLMLACIGSVVAVIAESPRLPIDDDFLMVVVPLVILRGVEVMM